MTLDKHVNIRNVISMSLPDAKNYLHDKIISYDIVYWLKNQKNSIIISFFYVILLIYCIISFGII